MVQNAGHTVSGLLGQRLPACACMVRGWSGLVKGTVGNHIRHAVCMVLVVMVPYPARSPSPPPRGHEPASSQHPAGERRKRSYLETAPFTQRSREPRECREEVATLTTTQPSTQRRWIMLSCPRRGRLPAHVTSAVVPLACMKSHRKYPLQRKHQMPEVIRRRGSETSNA